MPGVTTQRHTKAAASDGWQTRHQGDQEGQVDRYKRVRHLVSHSVALVLIEAARAFGIFSYMAVVVPTAAGGRVADGSCRGKNLYDVPSAGECCIAGAAGLRPVALLELWAACLNLDGGDLKAEVAECGSD